MTAFRSLLILALLAPAAASAQDAPPLDLSLPADSPYAKSPPGTWYGDTSGKPASSAFAEETEADDGKARVWGSFITGIGHSKGHGTSHFNAAEINVSKSFGEGERKNSINLQINVEQGDGPAFGGPAFGGHYPYPYYGHDTHYGPPPR